MGDVKMIKLSKVRDVLYDVSMETSCYFNTKTNEILWHFGFDEENSTYTEDDELKTENNLKSNTLSIGQQLVIPK